jgi:penicillin-binding protein 1C
MSDDKLQPRAEGLTPRAEGRKRRGRLAAAVMALACVVALALWARLGPLPDGFLDRDSFISTTVVDRNGVVLYEALSGTETRSSWMEPGEVPEALVAATLAAEDHRFFDHAGVDPVAIARAMLANARARRMVQGGSTLTQQLVKQIRIARGERPLRTTFRDKAGEMLLALRLEHRLTKDEILALYLNLAPYGNQYVGAKRAARGYFDRDPGMLTLAQAAFLAGLPRRPSGYDPYRHFDRASARQSRVLDRVGELDLAPEPDVETAKAERLALRTRRDDLAAPHLVQRVLAEQRGGRIRTTIDARLQRAVSGIIESRRLELERHAARNVAVAVLDNATGEWLAWEGSGNYFDARHGGAIDGVTTPRQPGSALKPFTYALAFEHGYTPASILPDIPSHFQTAKEGVLYSPRNYDGRFRGPLRARLALAGSQNVPAVALASEIGVPDVVRFLRRAGLTTLEKNADHYGLGITLGNAEVRLDELVAAYAMLARGGRAAETRYLAGGERAEGEQILSPRTAWWIAGILSDDDARAWSFGRGSSLEFTFPVASKTGTSQAYHDNWTIGFTRDVTVGVWVGNFDRTTLRNSSGVTGAAPIFRAVMLAALEIRNDRLPAPEDPPTVARDPGLRRVRICELTGLAATDRCPGVAVEELGEMPSSCDWHHVDDGETLVAWPPEYQAWARSRGLLRERAVAVAEAARAGDPAPTREARRPVFAISSPPSGATYLIDPTLRREFQTLPLRVALSGPVREIAWSVNGRSLGRSRSDGSIDWPLEPGEHRFVASDGAATAEATVVVK